MKYLLIIAIAALFSCKKQSGIAGCHVCQLSAVNGRPQKDTTLCGDITQPIHDQNGNDLPYYCP